MLCSSNFAIPTVKKTTLLCSPSANWFSSPLFTARDSLFWILAFFVGVRFYISVNKSTNDQHLVTAKSAKFSLSSVRVYVALSVIAYNLRASAGSPAKSAKSRHSIYCYADTPHNTHLRTRVEQNIINILFRRRLYAMLINQLFSGVAHEKIREKWFTIAFRLIRLF